MTIQYKITKYPELPADFNPEEDDEDASYDEYFDMYNDAETKLIKTIQELEAKYPNSRRQEFQIKKIYISNPHNR